MRDIGKQRMLYIDLDEAKTRVEELDAKVLKDYLGGRGVAANLLYQLVPRGIDPLGPENVLIFATGTLNGTSAPCSGRTTVTCKGPATGLYLKCSVGGHWGPELRYAGYDVVVVTGVAPEPSYLLVTNEKVEIRPAGHLWGLGTREVDAEIKSEVGDQDAQVALIGPAGENKVLFSNIIFSLYNSASRGGIGAVMGSKNLKAFAVRGKGGLRLSNGKDFLRRTIEVRQELFQDPTAQGLYMYGTAGFIPGLNEMGLLPTNNFTNPSIEGGEQLGGQYLDDEGYLVGRESCFACSIACHRYVRSLEHRYGKILDSGPELESALSLGAECGVIDTEALLKANQLCNDYGLDVISAGHVIAWALETFEKGVLAGEKDSDGLEMRFGQSETLLELLKLISLRSGYLGDLLAEGTKRAAEKVGGDSYKWAIQCKGLEMSAADTRIFKGYALSFALNPRGPDHLTSQCMAEIGLSQEAVDLVADITGDGKYADPSMLDKRAEIVTWHEDCFAATDALGFCSFSTTMAYNVTPKRMADWFSLATGLSLSVDELMTSGRRIVTLERCFNNREGLTRKEDTLPWRIMNDPVSGGSGEGAVTVKEDLDKMLKDYYLLNGWDVETGLPSTEILGKLGLLPLVGDR